MSMCSEVNEEDGFLTPHLQVGAVVVVRVPQEVVEVNRV